MTSNLDKIIQTDLREEGPAAIKFLEYARQLEDSETAATPTHHYLVEPSRLYVTWKSSGDGHELIALTKEGKNCWKALQLLAKGGGDTDVIKNTYRAYAHTPVHKQGQVQPPL